MRSWRKADSMGRVERVYAGAIQPIEPYWSGQQRCFMLDIRWNASYMGIELSGEERRR
jgi:hypothetical protein